MTKCAVAECSMHSSKRGWCNKHYLRWYAQARHTQCQAAGCTRTPRAGGTPWCEMHYYRIRRTGTPAPPASRRQADAGYRAAHARVAQDKGHARTYQCTDCTRTAHHWSYTHSDPNELRSPGGQPYSLNPSYYEPRCAPCHKVYDA